MSERFALKLVLTFTLSLVIIPLAIITGIIEVPKCFFRLLTLYSDIWVKGEYD